MKQCPMCDTPYPDEHSTCPTDGAFLIQLREWSPGTLIRNKYRILAKIGQGGMGTMYKAQHIGLEEVMALKVMGSHLLGDPSFVKRFRQEARAARKLQHRNIVQVTDFDQAEDGSMFIVMEFIDGISLGKLIDTTDGALPLQRAIHIVKGVAEGLGAAHEQGMVHRDIKPENILLGHNSRGLDVPKVADFGIVAMKETSLSLSSGLFLTPPYASPEQWRGMKSDALDGRSDLYSLGVTFFELLTGRLPFHEHTNEGWMRAHLFDAPPPPSQFNPRLAGLGIDALVGRLMAKDRDQRTRTISELLRDLETAPLPMAAEEPVLNAAIPVHAYFPAVEEPPLPSLPAPVERETASFQFLGSYEERTMPPTARLRFSVTTIVLLLVLLFFIIVGLLLLWKFEAGESKNSAPYLSSSETTLVRCVVSLPK